MPPVFTCTSCGKEFGIPEAALRKFPGWTPKLCLACRGGSPQAGQRRSSSGAQKPPARRPVESLPRGQTDPDELLELVNQRYEAGPSEGIFTDGACSGNPGPGGWAAARVKDGQLVDRAYGYEPHTTNNRMELTALIAGYRMVPPEEEATIWSDSQLCVNTVTKWAAGWQRNGWRRKGGPIANLELVKELYALAQERPRVELRWIKAHNGSRWNEYVDRLATTGI